MFLIRIAELASITLVRYGGFFIFRHKQVPVFKTLDNQAKSTIIVANHSAAMDPFLITANLRWRQVFTMCPYFFMMHNRFFDYPILRPWLYLHGCFPAFEHKKHSYGISRASELLSNGRTVVMFPEGKVTLNDRVLPAKKGVETLANLPNTQVLPVRVKWNRRRGIWRSYSMTVGQPFSGKNMTAEQIMDVVYSLKFR